MKDLMPTIGRRLTTCILALYVACILAVLELWSCGLIERVRNSNNALAEPPSPKIAIK